jgi:hypothetical protein
MNDNTNSPQIIELDDAALEQVAGGPSIVNRTGTN